MANPILAMLEGNGSLAGRDRAGAFTATGSGALRYAAAPNARINWFDKPLFVSALDGAASAATNGTVTWSTEQTRRGIGGAAKLVCNGAGNGSFGLFNLLRIPPVASGTSIVMSCWVYADAGAAGKTLQAAINNRSGSGAEAGISGASPVTLVEGWQQYSRVLTTNLPDVTAYSQTLTVVSPANGDTIYVTEVMWEYASSLGDWIDGVWLDPVSGVLQTAGDGRAVSRATYWIEQATTNYVTNPWFSTDTAGWSATNGSISRTTTRDARMQGAGYGVLTASAANATATTSITAPASTCTAQAIVSNFTNASRTYQLRYNGSDIGSPLVISGRSKATISATLTGTGGAANLELVVTDSLNTELSAISYMGAEPGGFATSPCPALNRVGTIQTGYSWSGTAHASTSSRAAATDSAATTNRINISSGSVLFRFLRSVDTGTEEIYGEVGTKGASTDHVRWGVDSSDRAFVEWSSNNAAYQRVTRTGALTIATKYLWYIDWSGTGVNIALGTESLTSGTRAATSGSWGAGNIVLEGAPSGQSVGPVVIYDRPLTAAERAKVNAAIDSNGAASLWTVLGSNAYRNFQLRPISQ